jgi:hypothetical protein
MTLIVDAPSGAGRLRTPILAYAGLTCEKQGAQRMPRGAVTPRNPARTQAWTIPSTQPCTLIAAA